MNIHNAYVLAGQAHINDNWGKDPYMVHLYLTVIELIRLGEYDNPHTHCAAVLHDVIEDHPEYSERVRTEFPEIYESLLIVSRQSDETYSEFIDRVVSSGDRVAITVKYCDMLVNLHNNPPKRLLERYTRHIGIVADAYVALTE